MDTDTPKGDAEALDVRAGSGMEPLMRSYTRQQLFNFCGEWADEHLADLKRESKDAFYARLGLLVDFSTDLFDSANTPVRNAGENQLKP